MWRDQVRENIHNRVGKDLTQKHEECLWGRREQRRLCHKMKHPGGNING